ncbi:MAG: response regulator [Caldilineaceae bacterium]|nr:response regulator [Caldilineaceae bacterium]
MLTESTNQRGRNALTDGVLSKGIVPAEDYDHFRREAFAWLAVVAGMVAWVWIGVALQAQQISALQGLYFVLLTLAAGWFIVRFQESHYRWAAVVFLTAQVIFIAYAYWITQNFAINYTFLLTIMMAGALLTPRMAYVTAVCIILFQMMWSGISLLHGVILLEVLTALVAWRASRGLHEALRSVEVSAQQARQHASEARQHRAELHRTLTSLDLANYQLQKANTELFYAREIADEALRFKAEFAAHISHELRTSLNLILGFSETMSFAQQSYGVRLPTPYLRDITEVYRNSRHLLSLIDDILDLSKLDAGRMGLHLEETNIDLLIAETVAMVQPLIETKGLKLFIDQSPQLPTVSVDRSRIRQVLLNLLSNATRITAQGHITIRIRQEGDNWLRFEVEDTGPGITEDELTRVFDEFHQLKGSSGSAGLGLAITQRIIHLHGGRIGVHSQFGVGSTFFFDLPLDPSLNPSSAAGRPIPPERIVAPVLIVLGEPESDEVKLLQRHLDAYQVTVTPSWGEAERLIRQLSARAVIKTGSQNGGKALSVGVPVIDCTLPSSTQMAKTLGVGAFIQKPVTVQNIQETLRRVAPAAKTVLVVDDEPAATRLLERMVLTHNPDYAIFRAYSGKEAYARLQAQLTDVVLLDMAMPDGDGIWLISQMRQTDEMAAIPIIGVSGRAVEEAMENQMLSITTRDGFTTTESLRYLQAILSVVPPAPVERYTNTQPSLTAPPG